MFSPMQPSIFPVLAAALCSTCLLGSCANQDDAPKPKGPQSQNSKISWTGQVTSPVQGQFGMMPQNQHRR